MARPVYRPIVRKNWTIEPMWRGQTCAVLASGESMTPDVAEHVRRSAAVRVIVVNNTFKLAPWADILYAADAPWWEKYHSQTTGFLGHKVCADDNGTRFDDVLQIKTSGAEGFDPDQSCIRHGGNSGYAAVHIATHLGCSRILLCGFDMKGGHWHEPHKYPLREHGEGIFATWIARFATLAPELKARGVEVLNCTPGSALKCFPVANLADALAPRAIAA